jgi:hypothetical protein
MHNKLEGIVQSYLRRIIFQNNWEIIFQINLEFKFFLEYSSFEMINLINLATLY